jgi:hypothetical protein
VINLIYTENRAFYHYISVNYSGVKPDDTLPTLSEINDIAEISELKSFTTENKNYLYNIYFANDDTYPFDIIILYDYDKDNNTALINNTFCIYKKYEYEQLDEIKYSKYDISGSTPQLSELYPSLMKKYNLADDSGEELSINSTYVYLTDKGFACVYYDEDYNYAGKFILEEPEIVKLYELYVNYDSNVIE